ncbi:MAG: hypothetical protein Aureis2KO_27620 [Aureisphaera sp.]
MNSKWYFGALFVVLTFLGIGLEQTNTPNQEIIVQFDNDNVTTEEAQQAIAIVREQLQLLGAENIKIGPSAQGKLKITYYSQIDVDSIKEILSEDDPFELGYNSFADNDGKSEFPSTFELFSYKLNVNEIKGGLDQLADYTGFVVEYESKTSEHRYFDADIYFSIVESAVAERNRIDKIAYDAQGYAALFIDNSSHNIPEVRAGPLTNFNI